MGEPIRKGKKLIVVAGPTASGKSILAMMLARRFGGTIINADAMQIYCEQPILSAQPSLADQAAIPHRLYGLRALNAPWSGPQWAAEAQSHIASANLAIVTGGTGFYLRILLEGLSLVPESDPAYLDEANRIAQEQGLEALYADLRKCDPESAKKIAPGDRQRIIRAWSVHRATGLPMGYWHRQVPEARPAFNPLIFVLWPERPSLYAACDRRFIAMMESGAVEEVDRIAARYPEEEDWTKPGFKTLGLRQLRDWRRGLLSRGAAIAAAQQLTRNYAKRQCTWFRHQLPNCNFIPIDPLYMDLIEKYWPGIEQKTNNFLVDRE